MADDGNARNGAGGDDYRTFSGAGFGTLMVQLAATTGPKETPPVASNRAYLRGSLPAVYQEGDFGMRFIGALETLLDPIVAVLDALPAHFSADHAPRDILDLLSAWLGRRPRRVPDARAAARDGPPGRRAGPPPRHPRRASTWPCRSPSRSCLCAWRTSGGVRTTPPEGGMETPAATFIVYCDKPIAEETAGGGRALHRAVQAGTHDVPAAREGGEEEGRRRARMRTCQSCGKQNPPDRDFCDCGEYLRWEPTGLRRRGHAGDGRRGRRRGAARRRA